eukprot:6508936-Prymnesium_polylepis.1
MFACEGCALWAHTECYAAYRGVDDDELPARMWCHRCEGDSAHHGSPTSDAAATAETSDAA